MIVTNILIDFCSNFFMIPSSILFNFCLNLFLISIGILSDFYLNLIMIPSDVLFVRLNLFYNIRNTFSKIIEKIISKYLSPFNSIYMGRCKFKIVIKSNLSNVTIFYLF